MAEPSGRGQRIARARRRRGLSQATLAGLVGRSESWLSQVERGLRQIQIAGGDADGLFRGLQVEQAVADLLVDLYDHVADA